jgi:hypothetical protein
MRRTATIRTVPLVAALLLLPFAATAQVSPLFLGDTADVWVVDGETGQVTGYDRGLWVNRFIAMDYVGIDLGPNDAVLVNRLPASSIPMRGGRPPISLAGIGDAALDIGKGGAGGHRDLTIRPEAGDHTGTIAVVIGASASVLSQGPHRLTWMAVKVESGASTTVVSGNRVLAQNAGGVEDGYHYETFYLVDSGDYTVNATLRGAGADAAVAASYTLAIPVGEERRDTDGDGIPDAVEVDMGLNPLEDDWTADTDANGWSEFDEWLRRYCLDPSTLQPLDGGPTCLDADDIPLDSDNDTWSDFDEILRGTNHLDPEPVIPEQMAAPAGNEDETVPAPGVQPVVSGSEYEARQRLRFKDFPAANRLYEVEHFIAAGTGVLSVAPLANLQLEQQSAGAGLDAYAGIVVQSITAAQDNIAGIDIRVAASADEVGGVEDIYLNIWADSLRDGELLLSQKIDDVVVNGDPDRPIIIRFEPVAVQPGQQIYLEFRKKNVALVTTAADTLGGGGVVEINGTASAGQTDLVLDVYYDANFADGIGGTRAGMQWWTVGAAGLDGTLAYDAIKLLHDSDITAAGLLPADISPRRRMTTLANALGGNRLPELRLPAGDSQIVTAVHRHHVPEQTGWRAPADYSRAYKVWLPRMSDVTLRGMLAELGAGSWTTPSEWRRDFIAYLVPRLVVPLAITLDESSTLEVAIVEAALSEEARLDGSGGVQLLNGIFQPGVPIYSYQPGQPVFGDLLSHQSGYTNAWEDHLGRLALTDFNLDQSILEVRAAMAAGQPLEPLVQWLRQRFYAGIAGTASDKYMAQQMIAAFPDVCVVPTNDIAGRQADVAGWNDFLDQCPAWRDDAGYAQELEAMRDRCYLVRLNLLPGATTETGGDATLLDRDADSDADGALNRNEIELPVRDLTLPWLFDSDGDSIADSVDPCPNDPYNDCSANPVRPEVTLDADFSVFEPLAGSDFALVTVQLGRLYDVPVTVCYEAIMDVGDTATADVDFAAVTGCVTIAPGQLSALIAIPINADGVDEGAERFTVRITSVTNGTLADDGVVVITLNDTAAGGAPIVVLANSSIVANERDLVTMNASGSSDPAGGALGFSWQQIDNGQPAVTLGAAGTAVASFTAPTTLTPLVLQFEVTVTNAALLSATGQVTVTVNPVNDPPYATGTPFAQVISGNSYEWTDAALLAFVEDPENDPLSLGAISQQPGIGSVVDTGNGFTYTSDQGGNLKLSDSQIGEWVINGTETHVVLNETGPAADFPGTDRVVAVNLADGARTLLLEGDYGYLMRPAPGSSAVYFRGGSNGNLYRYDPDAAQPLLSTPVPDPFPGAFAVQETAVDPFSGDLHYCMKDSATNNRNWYRIDATDMSVNVGYSGCGTPVGIDGGRMGKRFCVLNQTYDELICTAPNGNVLGDGGGYNFSFDPTDPGASYDVVGIRQVGDALLVFTSKSVFNAPQNLKVWLAHDTFFVVDPNFPGEPVFEPRLLLESPLGMQDDPPEVEVLPDGRTVMVIAQSQYVGGDGSSRQMWTWSGDLADNTMSQLNIGTSTVFADHLGKLKYANGKLYWHVQDQVGNTERQLFEVDPTPGAPNALQLVATVTGTLGRAPEYRYGSSEYDIFVPPSGGINVLTPFASGVCDLVEPLSGTLVQQWVGCQYHASVPNRGLLLNLDEPLDGDADIDNLYLLGGSSGAIGNTSFSVEVSDGENVIELPVNIEVLAP